VSDLPIIIALVAIVGIAIFFACQDGDDDDDGWMY